MRQRVRGPSTLFVACVLLSGAAQALAGNGTSAPSEPATAKPVIPTPAAVVPAKPAEPDAGQALSVAEKAALAKQRMERCRLHPGSSRPNYGEKQCRDGPFEGLSHGRYPF